MKNSSIKAMIKDQFKEASFIHVEFLAAVGQEEEYKVLLLEKGDDTVLREFKLIVTLQEVEKND